MIILLTSPISRFASLLLLALPAGALAAPELSQNEVPGVEKPAKKRAAPVDDVTLALSVASALVNARVGGVQVEARQGRVTIKGVVDDAATIKRALAAASGVAGVRELENRLVSAELVEHD